MLNADQVKFCEEECKRQQVGNQELIWMKETVSWVQEWYLHWENVLSHEAIQFIGFMIEREKNNHGYRTTPVIVGGTTIPWSTIKRQLTNLFENTDTGKAGEQDLLTPEDFYKEFELIHPFIDGNGRVGAILYNYLRETLEHPVAPPDLFGGNK